jgi:sugar lactone lactonase YvrE
MCMTDPNRPGLGMRGGGKFCPIQSKGYLCIGPKFTKSNHAICVIEMVDSFGRMKIGVVAMVAGYFVLASSGSCLGQSAYSTPFTFTTLAGNAGVAGATNGTGTNATFWEPSGVAVDRAGSLYVADYYNYTIRKITPSGAVTTFAGSPGYSGSTNGTGSGALFYYPLGVALDSAGNVYVTDAGNSTVRKITPAGVVTTLAGLAGIQGTNDGTGSDARFNVPWGVAVDPSNNVYVGDFLNSTIRKITPDGVVSTLAGLAGASGSVDGTGTNALFNGPSAVALDGTGNLYVTDYSNQTIRTITPLGQVTTLAGNAGHIGSADGTGTNATFYNCCGLVVDGGGNVYVADTWNETLRMVTPAGVVTTLAGLAGGQGYADGTGSTARFYSPAGLALDNAGNLYVTEAGNNTIRKGRLASLVPEPVLQLVNANPGQFSFEVSGLPNLAVDIEASTDLQRWQVTASFTLGGGKNYLVRPVLLSRKATFFRAHVR